MPRHLFWECLHLDHATAIRANISRQNYSVCPRYWYVDAVFKCSRCSENFCFTAAEQKRWYEELGFYVDSYAKNCQDCRRDERKRKELRQIYDHEIEVTLQSKDIEAKKRLASLIDEMCSFEAVLPQKIHENRRVLGRQIDRSKNQCDG
ncbi:MAG: zinc-ribbon domain containing protein [Pirellulaceae bacterium]|nr:zinc-ribbon domain containing protein [Pirellulaceae bacterium]